MVIIEMENGGKIELELYPEHAPKTVANFEALVKDGFYNGLTFHRVIPGFMIQGGDPLGNGMGGSDKKLYGEFRANGHNNPIKHERGVISMARAYDPNSASSQFFIMHVDYPSLNEKYASFGYVVYGMDTVDGIANTEVTYNASYELAAPVHSVVINSATFMTAKG